MTIRFVEDIYADFLFDCYIANQHLTDEDWHYYGREEHHIELPERDGGVLTPLNSQPLTTYQHWIAGTLQSEVLGKCCFACVPKDVLPPMFEMLRAKWQSHHGKQTTTGREVREATRQKIRNSLMNHEVSGETRRRQSDAQKGKKLTKKTRQRMSTSRTGSRNANWGKKWFHNPLTQANRMFIVGEQPEGWVIGVSEECKRRNSESVKRARREGR